jgi:hypothetical protein
VRVSILAVFLIAALQVSACGSDAPQVRRLTSPPALESPAATVVPPDAVLPGAPDVGASPVEVVQAGTATNVHEVAVESITVQRGGDGRFVARPVWWSGVEPCNVLARTEVSYGSPVVVHVYEGTGEADAVCVELAQQKTTTVDLGDVVPGTQVCGGLPKLSEDVTIERPQPCTTVPG